VKKEQFQNLLILEGIEPFFLKALEQVLPVPGMKILSTHVNTFRMMQNIK